MSAIIISERHRVKEYWYSKRYYKKGADHDSWYSFECDEFGNVLLEKLQPGAIKNYKRLKDDINWYSKIEKESRSYMENAKANCPYCHKTIELWDEYLGACECECGQWYNLFGQEVTNPDTWDLGDDW